ncbi:TonB-dependent receptor [Sediminibacterium soli]|uniref:TonB-dependent receptor n=1 Tax=Sediminibacterium soli TaxID=2698829 RepID=UPI00137B4D83|nr:TonB-dependent receptor [Sediminibacterium soli]NCI47097.1 TonB-dependent receptor plug domain-containing protein [Sediminibacterium soli]
MRKLKPSAGLLLAGTLACITVQAQQSTIVSGSVKSGKTNEAISAVSVTIKGGTTGTFTDDKGNFRFTTVQKPPFTLVISSVGYATREVAFTGAGQVVNVDLEQSFTLGDEVVVAASRVPERILESPVSIERVGPAAIRNAATPSYYDLLTNLKGVDVVSASFTFRSVGTRGFNVSGNSRLNQLVDGMDNQAPGLNFSVGSVGGLTELDVENMELLPGASSALYGSGGMNGTVLINSKNPFKYQGLSFQVKTGLNHIDGKQRPRSTFHDWSLRWADKLSEKFAFKIGAQFVQAQDWLANQSDNYLRPPTPGAPSPNGGVIPGSRTTDPNYDGVNVYGDETSQNISQIANSVFAAAGLPSVFLAGSGAFLAANPTLNIAGYNAFLAGALGAPTANALIAAGVNNILFGAGRNYYNNQYVSRTGYAEKDVINPTTVNVKLSGALHYKLSDNTEASFAVNYGTGNSVYTGSDRYSLKDLRIAQFRLELKSKNWFLRAYTTHENAGSTFNATITTRLFNEAWKPSTAWYPQYLAAYAAMRDAGMANIDAHNAARGFADAGRPTGNIGQTALFQKVASTPISQGGGLFLDESRLNVFEGQYNLTNDLGLNKTGTEFLVGASSRQFVLNSQGTIFADTAGRIKINEVGAYAQLSQKFFGDVLKLSVSGRYDKNTNFKGRFTPRATAVLKLAQDHNIRASYQQAYRFPTTQNQWINLTIGGGTRLMGGLSQLRDFYKFSTNPVYTPESVGAFGASVVGGSPNTGLLVQQNFGEFKAESMRSFEVGYKGLIARKLLIDVYAYWAKYRDFLSSVNAIQARVPVSAGGSFTDLLDASKRIAYSIAVNTPGDVKTSGWGASVDWLLGRNYTLGANLYHDEIGDLPAGFVSYFNTPKYRANLMFGNSGLGKSAKWGFNVVYRYVDGFRYEGSFAVGQLPSNGQLDAVISYKCPSIKSLIKVGGTNIFNSYYRTAFGSPEIGGLYYISFGYNVF